MWSCGCLVFTHSSLIATSSPVAMLEPDGRKFQHISSSSNKLRLTTKKKKTPHTHRGKYPQRIRFLSSSRGGTCSPPSTPWPLSVSTHWRGQRTHADTHTHTHTNTQERERSCHQSLLINRVEGHCGAKLQTFGLSPYRAAEILEENQIGKTKKSGNEMWKSATLQVTEPKQWHGAAGGGGGGGLPQWNWEGKPFSSRPSRSTSARDVTQRGCCVTSRALVLPHQQCASVEFGSAHNKSCYIPEDDVGHSGARGGGKGGGGEGESKEKECGVV